MRRFFILNLEYSLEFKLDSCNKLKKFSNRYVLNLNWYCYVISVESFRL